MTMDVYHTSVDFKEVRPQEELLTITAKQAKEFRRQFYMGRRSRVLKPNYVANKPLFWKEVNTFFDDNHIAKTFHSYTFMCGFDVYSGVEIIMPQQLQCTEGHFTIVRNDVAWMITNKVDMNGVVRTRHFYHMLSNQCKLEGYTLKVRGVFAYNEDCLITQVHLNNFSFINKRCPKATKLVAKLNSFLN